MANTLATPNTVTAGAIAKEALFQLENNLVMGGLVHREYKHEFVNPKTGGTVAIRKPVKFVAEDGAARVNQDVTEQTTSINVNQRKHVSWKFSSEDLTMSIEDYAERYIRPACIALTNNVDSYLCQIAAQQFFMNVGTPGTTPGTFAALGNLAKRLDKNAVPTDMRRTILDPDANWAIADGLKGLNNERMVNEFVRKGFLANLAASEVYMDQNVYRLTTGTRSGSPLVNEPSGVSEGDIVLSIDTLGGATDTIKAGEKFTIAGVNAINPVSKADLGVLQEFTVLADATASGSAVTLTVSPAMYSSASKGLQTISALPANNAAVTFIGNASTTYAMNFGFHRSAIALVTCPIALPDGAAFKARVNHRGLSIRVVKSYDIDSDDDVIRLDILYGGKVIYDDLGAVLWG